MGPKHISKYQPNTIVNNSFTILEEFVKSGTTSGKNYWMYRCKCNCGNIFEVRQHEVDKRFGCKSCTAKTATAKRSKDEHNGIEQAGIKRRKYKEYQVGAVKRNLSFNLTFDQFLDITSKKCVYCGEEPHIYPGDIQYMQSYFEPWKRNGIDRIDSSKGYSLDNCVSCCEKCNYAKHEMSLDEFKQWIIKIHNYLICSSTTIPQGSTSQANGDGNDVRPNQDEDIV